MSAKKLFVENKYTRQPGFVILVRDNKLYRQALSFFEKFIPFNPNSCQDVGFTDILATDKIYALPNEDTMCEYVLGGKCLDKFKYKSETKADIDAVIKVLNSGKFIGYQTGVDEKDEKVRIQKGINKSINFLYKDGAIATWYERNNDSISGGRDRFFVFDTEYDLWQWVITGTQSA
jgi:hypothetical protein